MATQRQILEIIESHPEGVTLQQLANELDTKPFGVTKNISDLKKKGHVAHSEDGIYSITPEGEKSLERQRLIEKDIPVPSGELPGDYDVFKQIGDSVGVKGDFLEAVTRHIFRLDYRDIGTVFQELNSLALRPDVVVRWGKLWASHLGVPVPPQASPPSGPTVTATPPSPRRFSVIGDAIFPDAEGEYTLTEALKIFETKQSRGLDASTSEALRELRQSISELKEERFRDTISAQQSEIQSLRDKIGELAGAVVDLRRPTGRTEMDILHEIATETISLAKSELPAMRRDIKEAFTAGALPPLKTQEERTARQERFRKALSVDKKIERLGYEIFFPESIPEERKVAPPVPVVPPPKSPPPEIPLVYE